MSPGIKTYTVDEPPIIKNSSFLMRKEFAKGVLMFDGCVTKENRINFSSASERLSKSIKEIFCLDGIEFSESFDKRGCWAISTYKNVEKEKLLDYFEPMTQKWKLISWLSGSKKPYEERPYIKEKEQSISFTSIVKLLKKIKRCDANFLMKHFKCSHTTVRNYLKTLELQGRISLSNKPSCVENADGNTTVLLNEKFHSLLFNEIENKFILNKNCANFLKINKSTISAWKVRKNRIPLYILKEMCNILKLNFSEFCKNIEEIDRELVEII